MRLAIVLPLLFCLAGVAQADPLEDLAKAQQDTLDAWVKTPLTEQIVTFIKVPSPGYGIYEKRENNVFKQGELMITYVEPIGYGWKELPGEMYEVSFVVDLLLKDDNGSVLVDKKAFSAIAFQTHNANMELKLDLTLTPNGLPAGKYVLAYTIHDISADQTSSFEEPFEVASGS